MKLDPCPSSPNCISSQAEPSDREHFMAAIPFTGTAEEALAAVAEVLGEATGAVIKERSAESVRAVFTTRFFRFKDDVIFAVDQANKMLHFRSASRVGHSDLGANRKRLETLLPQISARL
ncbi:MAG: DUF1499 domain-containing protein [Acidimicrobiales bacterium]|nr:DUF1499 domain-containing protein [Acidimicrobiales bacterium]